MAALPIFYLVETFFHKGDRKRAHRPDESRFFHGSILVAGLMLVGGLSLKMVDFLSDFSLDTTERVFGVAMGLTRRVVLRHDYMPFEFALLLYRDQRRSNRNIFQVLEHQLLQSTGEG